MLSRLILFCALLAASVLRADDLFTKSLTAADFQSAGLGKLTPEELGRLDALVRARLSGAVAQTKEDTTKTVAAQVRQEVQEDDRKAAQKQGATAGFIDRVKVVLEPGTEIEYATLDAALASPFHGWKNGTIFTLTNGQRWVVTEDDEYWASATGKTVHVRIVPGVLGSFFMEIERGGRPRVKFLGNAAVPQSSR